MFAIAKIVYYPTAVIFSHEAYKKIKQFSIFSEGTGNNFGDYQLMETTNQVSRARQEDRSFGGFRPFQGNAVPLVWLFNLFSLLIEKWRAVKEKITLNK